MTLSSLFDHPSVTESFLHDNQLEIIYCLSVSGHSFIYDLTSKEYQLITWSLRDSRLQINTDDSVFILKCIEQTGSSLSMERYNLVSKKWIKSATCTMSLVDTSTDSIFKDRRRRDLGAFKTWAPGVVVVSIFLGFVAWYL